MEYFDFVAKNFCFTHYPTASFTSYHPPPLFLLSDEYPIELICSFCWSIMPTSHLQAPFLSSSFSTCLFSSNTFLVLKIWSCFPFINPSASRYLFPLCHHHFLPQCLLLHMPEAVPSSTCFSQSLLQKSASAYLLR